MKKKILLLSICFLILSTNAFAELTQSDLKEIDKLIQASENRIKEYTDLNCIGGFDCYSCGVAANPCCETSKEMRTQDQRIDMYSQICSVQLYL